MSGIAEFSERTGKESDGPRRSSAHRGRESSSQLPHEPGHSTGPTADKRARREISINCYFDEMRNINELTIWTIAVARKGRLRQRPGPRGRMTMTVASGISLTGEAFDFSLCSASRAQ